MPAPLDIADALDPARLFRAAGIGRPDPWQADVLRAPWERLLMLCSRQSGKSTTVAALAAHTAVYEPGSLTLITAPAQRQAKETLAKFWRFFEAENRPVDVQKKSELRVRFTNGSRVIALPGSEQTIRGYSGVDLLILDEAARVVDDLYASVRPMLAVSGGRLAALTTPNGKRGWFYEAWTGAQDWKRVKITAHDCPRISGAFLDEERRELGDWMYRQEYLCEFVDNEQQLFATEDIEGAVDERIRPLFGPASSEAAAEDAPERPRVGDTSIDPLFTHHSSLNG